MCLEEASSCVQADLSTLANISLSAYGISTLLTCAMMGQLERSKLKAVLSEANFSAWRYSGSKVSV